MHFPRDVAQMEHIERREDSVSDLQSLFQQKLAAMPFAGAHKRTHLQLRRLLAGLHAKI